MSEEVGKGWSGEERGRRERGHTKKMEGVGLRGGVRVRLYKSG